MLNFHPVICLFINSKERPAKTCSQNVGHFLLLPKLLLIVDIHFVCLSQDIKGCPEAKAFANKGLFLTPKTFSAFVCYVVAIILMYILLSKFPLLKYKETGEIVYILKRACVQNSLNIIQHYDTCRTFGVEGIIKYHFR